MIIKKESKGREVNFLNPDSSVYEWIWALCNCFLFKDFECPGKGDEEKSWTTLRLMKNEQFWHQLVLRILKIPLVAKFDKEFAEILSLKHWLGN